MNSRRPALKSILAAIGIAPMLVKVTPCKSAIKEEISGVSLSRFPKSPLGSLIMQGGSTYMRVYADTPLSAGNFVFWTDRANYRVSDKSQYIDLRNMAGCAPDGKSEPGPHWIAIQGQFIYPNNVIQQVKI